MAKEGKMAEKIILRGTLEDHQGNPLHPATEAGQVAMSDGKMVEERLADLTATAEQRECVNCLQCITRRTQSTDECFTCPIAQGCAWCSAYNYQEFGTPDKRATYICEMHKARVWGNVYFWNRAYAKHGENKAFANNVPDEWALKIIGEQELAELKKIERV